MRFWDLFGFLIGADSVPTSLAAIPDRTCTRIPEGEYRFSITDTKHFSIDVGTSPSTFWIDFSRDPRPGDDDSGIGSDHDDFYDRVPLQIRKRIEYTLEPDCTIVIDHGSVLAFLETLDAITLLVDSVMVSGLIMAKYDLSRSAIVLGEWMDMVRVPDNTPSRPLVRVPVQEGHYINISSSGMVSMIRVLNSLNLVLSVASPITREGARDVRVFAEYTVLPHNKLLVRASVKTSVEDLDFLRSLLNTLGDVSSPELLLRYNPDERSISVGKAEFKIDEGIVVPPRPLETSEQV
jgi:hypothetical protein